MAFLRQLFGLRSFFPRLFASLTVLWLIVEPIAVFKKVPNSWYCYVVLIILGLVCAVIWNWPKACVKHRFRHNDVTVRIVKGDVLGAHGNVVIGFCDTFDTQIGRLIKDTSLQGQFQRQVFGGDSAALDARLDELLEPSSRFAIHDPDKPVGKQLRFPLGTVLPLHQGKQYFLAAYTKMGNDLACAPTPARHILATLFSLWDAVRQHGQNDPVAIPVIASDFARSGLSRTTLIKMIVLSFCTSQATSPVAKELSIYVHPSDAEHVDFNGLKLFLQTM